MIFRSFTFLLFTCFLICTTTQSSQLAWKIEEIFGKNDTDPVITEPSTEIPIKAQNSDLNRIIQEMFGSNTTGPIIKPEGCECVPYYRCNATDVGGDHNACPSYLDVCCKREYIIVDPVQEIPKPLGCGRRNIDGIGFRLTETEGETYFGEFPWMVVVLRVEQVEGKSLNVHQCGGSLIHPQVVMTAAHCVLNKTKVFRIRAGEWDTETTKELLPHQDRKVRSIIIHPDYNNDTLHNDVALAIVESPFVLDEHINVVCLPPTETFTADGTKCWMTSWDRRRFDSIVRQHGIMKKFQLPFVNRNDCLSKLRTMSLGKYFQLHKNFVCAGDEAVRNTCKGDDGEPLVCPIPGKPNHYQQLGIVFRGIGCANAGELGIYVNVASFRGWLDEEMKKQGFNTTTYTY